MQSTKWELYEYQRSRSVIDLGPNHLHSIFLNFFSSITADFNISSAIRWAIQDQWSSGSLLFLIGSFWYFYVTRTSIKAWMGLNFRQIRLLTMELAALERLKHQCLHFFSVGIDPILFKVGGYIDMHNILHEFEFWPNGTTDYGVICPWASKKLMSPRFLGCY